MFYKNVWSVLFCQILCNISSGRVLQHIILHSDSVLLEGCPKIGLQNYWEFEKRLLFIDQYLYQQNFADSICILANNSIYIKSVSLCHEGTYTCISNSSTVKTHLLTVTGLYNKEDSKLWYVQGGA